MGKEFPFGRYAETNDDMKKVYNYKSYAEAVDGILSPEQRKKGGP